MGFVGRSVPRLEDRPLVTGRGRFAADVVFPHMLHMRVVRSPHAHGRIVSIDSRAARASARRRRGLDLRRRGRHAADRFPADPDRRLGALPPDRSWRASACAMSASRSQRCSRPIRTSRRMRPTWSRSRSRNCRSCSMQRAARRVRGRPFDRADDRWKSPTAISTAAFRAAHAVVELDLAIGRHSGVPMETRGAIARYDAASDVLELYGAAKVPHWNRDNIARMLGRDPSTVHLDSKAMSAAASASAASSIPRTCWSASPRCGSAGR